MKLYSVLVTSIFLSGFLIIGCASSSDSDKNYNKENLKETSINNVDKKLSEKEASDLVKKYLEDKNSYIPNFIEVDNVDGDKYIVHAYDVITNKEESHIATSGWFEVNMYTGEIVDIMNQ